MKPASPVVPGSSRPEVVYAKDQPEYLPLPSVRFDDGTVVTRWVCDGWRERLRLMWTGYVYLTVLTFNHPLQPLRMETAVPSELSEPPEEPIPDSAKGLACRPGSGLPYAVGRGPIKSQR